MGNTIKKFGDETLSVIADVTNTSKWLDKKNKKKGPKPLTEQEESLKSQSESHTKRMKKRQARSVMEDADAEPRRNTIG